MKAIEEGLFTRTTKERLDALEAQKDELTAKIADEKLRKPSFNADFIRFWLMKFRKFDISQQKQRKALIEIFVNAIFLYDDRMLITFNYKDGSQTIRFEDGSYNRFAIQDGYVSMPEASCPDQICVHHSRISRNKETIVCLPDKVVITIENGEDSGIDVLQH